MLTAFVLTAALGVVLSMISGIVAMTHGGTFNHVTSVQWMGLRVAFQAAALFFIVLAVVQSWT